MNELLKHAKHLAENYLRDEMEDQRLCVDDAHHEAVVKFFEAIRDAERDASLPEGATIVLATEKGLTPFGECIAALEEMIASLEEVDDYPAQEKATARARAALKLFGPQPGSTTK